MLLVTRLWTKEGNPQNNSLQEALMKIPGAFQFSGVDKKGDSVVYLVGLQDLTTSKVWTINGKKLKYRYTLNKNDEDCSTKSELFEEISKKMFELGFKNNTSIVDSLDQTFDLLSQEFDELPQLETKVEEVKKGDYTKKSIDQLILKYYSEFPDIVPLNYQINYVHQALSTFNSFVSTKMDRPFYDQYNVEKPAFIGSEQIYGKQKDYLHYIINLDVGLGKTITSILTTKVLLDMYNDMYTTQRDLYLKNNKEYTEAIKGNKTVEGLSNMLSSQILEYINDVGEDSFKVSIIARKNLCLEFQHFLKGDPRFNYYPSGRGVTDVDANKNKLKVKLLEYFLYYNNSRGTVKPEGIRPESLGLPEQLFIIDEYGYGSPAFGENSQARQILNGRHHFALGLTANAQVDNMYRNRAQGPHSLKTDPEISKELQKNHLYSSNNVFTYKFVTVKNVRLEKELARIHRLKQDTVVQLSKNLENLKEYKETFQRNLDKLFSNKKIPESEMLHIINEMTILKDNATRREQMEEQQQFIVDTTTRLEDMNRSLQTVLYRSPFEIMNEASLNYLFEGNTVILLDDSHSDQSITHFKQELRDNELHVYNTETYRQMSGGGNVLVCKVREGSKGLNLQHFDSIVFLYIDNITVNDIYQGIGRVDRIGTDKEKEIVLMTYSLNQDYINTIVNKKSEYNDSISLNIVQSTSSIQTKELTTLFDTLNQNENKVKEIQEGLDQAISEAKELSPEEKKRLEVKIKFLTENKKVFKDLIKNIEEKFKNTQTLLLSLMGGTGAVDDTKILEKEYYSSLFSIF